MAIKFPSYRRKVALILAVIESFIFAGTIFGWNSLTHVFQAQGYFQSAESREPASSVDFTDVVNKNKSEYSKRTASADSEQDRMFNLVFTWALFFLGSSTMLTGWMFDAYGSRRSKIIFIFFLAFGYLLFGLSSTETPWLLFPASVLVAVCGNGLMITNVHIGNMFIKRRSLVISLLYGFFDSSGSVAHVINILFDLGISTRILFYVWSGSCSFLLINALKILPAGKVSWPPPKELLDVTELSRQTSSDGKAKGQSSMGRRSRNQSQTSNSKVSNHSNLTKAQSHNFSMMLATEDPRFKSYADDVNLGFQLENYGRASASNVNLRLAIRESRTTSQAGFSRGSINVLEIENQPTPPLLKILLSSTFILQVVWFLALSFIVNFYIGTYYFWVKHLTSDNGVAHENFEDVVSHYTSSFQYAMLTGFIWCPLAGFVMDRHRKQDKLFTREEEMEYVIFPLFLTSIVALVFQSSLLLAPFWMPVLYFSSLLMAVLRGFLYTLGGAYFLLVFPSMYFGKLVGAEVLMSSFTMFGQYYLQNFVRNNLSGNPFMVHLFLLVLAVLSLVHPTNLFFLSFHRKQKKKWEMKRLQSQERVIYV